ncbi:restriction endonuclease subunit S [Marinilabilia salmonicolor]|uniref:Type I restriction enzyme S subunit n=1 Tax=Marinilabilia salmonicolor TaxID=989 RepID=A0A368VHR5_9BACT|nr:restriction endonuclease subunit S [Marinilabilia salmonicolor]RCW38541.1 type I restriction enzyme S subunit [Marinilabilia salmonicolor]
MVEFEYKNTGIDWLSKFPKHWRIDRIKDHFRDDLKQINEKDLSKIEEVAHYSIPSFDENGEPEICTGDSIRSGKKVLKGIGVLYSKLNCWKPRVWSYAINKDDILSVASTEFIGLRPIHDNQNDLTYIQYLLSSEAFTSTVKIFLKSVTNSHQRISPETFVSQNIPLPPLPEQKAIANYLDKACRRIDSIIDIKQKQLERIDGYFSSKVKEIISSGVNKDHTKKESGFDWFKNIPKNWKVVRLKSVLSKINSGVTPKGGSTSYIDEGIPLIRSQNIRFNKLDLSEVVYITEDIHNGMSNSKLIKGDVLLNITGASLGRCFYYNSSDEANVNQHVCILRPFQLIRTKFLYYLMRSEIGQAQILSGFTGSGREGLSFESIKRFRIPLPPKDEQEQIEIQLDSLSLKIQKLNEKIKNQITTLQAYRKSLIHECVTGKKQIWKGKIETVS